MLLQQTGFLQGMEQNVSLRPNQEVRVMFERGLRIFFCQAKEALCHLRSGWGRSHPVQRSAG
jgi:hypothetical protein